MRHREALNFVAAACLAAASACAMVSLGGCSRAPDAVPFHAVDLTGADYAKDFSLPDQTGRTRTLADFRGKVVVVFFGYTQCPDVCPTTMAELAEVKKQLGPDGERLQAVFVSVDPARDTPPVLSAYMSNFDPSFIALRPTAEQLAAIAKDYKVYYKKVDGPAPGSYTMDHSAGSYLYDPQGRLRLYSRYGSGSQALAEDIKGLLRPS